MVSLILISLGFEDLSFLFELESLVIVKVIIAFRKFLFHVWFMIICNPSGANEVDCWRWI